MTAKRPSDVQATLFAGPEAMFKRFCSGHDRETFYKLFQKKYDFADSQLSEFDHVPDTNQFMASPSVRYLPLEPV